MIYRCVERCSLDCFRISLCPTTWPETVFQLSKGHFNISKKFGMFCELAVNVNVLMRGVSKSSGERKSFWEELSITCHGMGLSLIEKAWPRASKPVISSGAIYKFPLVLGDPFGFMELETSNLRNGNGSSSC